MHSVFTPALGSVTHVAYDGVTPTTLRFSVTLNRADYYDLKRSGGTVQVWTDVPVQGKAKGKWDAISFTEDTTSRIEEKLVNEDDGVPELSLVSVQDELEEEEQKLSSGKTLSVSVQLNGGFILGSYSFTYRISYPTGGIRWLGSYGHNGVFVLESVAADRVGDIDLEPGWAKTSGWVRDVEDEATIGKVPSAGKFKIWAIGKDGAPDASLQQAALLLLLPRPSHDTAVIPLTSALLVASGETVLSLRPDGSLIATGKGSVYAQAPADYNLERVLTLHSSLEFKVLSASADHNHGCITHFVRKDRDRQPTYGLAFPSSSSSSSSFSVELDSGSFPSPELALYSSASHQARLLSSSPKLRIAANSIGGSFVVAPSYSITPNTNIVLTSSHVSSSPPVELPTPPPSPLMRPFHPRPLDTLSHPQSESSFQSFSLPPKEIVVEAPTPGEPAAEAVRPPVEKLSIAPEPPKEAEDPPLEKLASPRTELISAVNVWKEKGIVSFIEHLTKVFMIVIIAVLFQRGAVSYHKTSPKVPAPKEEKVEKVAAEPPHPSQHGASEAPQAPEDLETRSEAGTEGTVVDAHTADPPLPQVGSAPASSSEAIPAPVKSQQVAPAVHFDVPMGVTHMVLFTESSKNVVVELEGAIIDPRFTEIGEDVYEAAIKVGTPEGRSSFRLKVGLNEGP